MLNNKRNKVEKNKTTGGLSTRNSIGRKLIERSEM